MSVKIKIQHALKKYGDHIVIKDLNLDIKEGEFFTLLGPSGCGKTTLLRMIAGFNSIEGGDFYFNEKRINDVDPGSRNIGMVFQNYAIFPHLSVKDNVAFGLTNRKIDQDTRNKKTDEFLKLMQIDEFKNRMPDKLSGGQQQRVALARALVIQPDVLLMDEPLSNLDAKLRIEMRSVIKEIQHQVGITSVYVTHDQEEAMAISDRIAVMNKGSIQQIGSPKMLYQRPTNLFVATFIGYTNILKSTLDFKDDQCFIKIGNALIPIKNIKTKEKQNVLVSIRPEEFYLSDNGCIEGIIESSIFLGLNTHYKVHLNGLDQSIELIQESSIDNIIPDGTKINLNIKTDKINVFTADGEQSLTKD